MNLRPSGYEPDELPGCSTPRGYGWWGICWKTWRRPTFPCLGAQYHGRWGFSRPSSGWDRVRAPRHGHQVVRHILDLVRVVSRASGWARAWDCCVCCERGCVVGRVCCHAWRRSRACRAIRTGQLRALPHVYTRPIDVMVCHGPRGDLVLRWVSRLDAFSGYPVRT